MKLRAILTGLLLLACGPLQAQVNPGTSPLSIPKGGTAGATASAARTNLGVPTGTSGAVLGFLNTANTWSAAQTFPNNSLTLAEFPTIGANRVLGSVAGGTPAELTPAQLTTMIAGTGTSGGVACFTLATTLVSSVAMTANAIMLGGGAGACPTPLSLGTTTTVLHGNAAGPPSYGAVAYADIATAAIASAAQYLAGTGSELVQSGTIYQAETVTTFGATTTFDFSTFINTAVTLTGNITTQTLSNVPAGKAGTITFIQDGTGSRTTVWNSIFKFSAGVVPVLSTAANAIDVLSYSCRSATICIASLTKDVR